MSRVDKEMQMNLYLFKNVDTDEESRKKYMLSRAQMIVYENLRDKYKCIMSRKLLVLLIVICVIDIIYSLFFGVDISNGTKIIVLVIFSIIIGAGVFLWIKVNKYYSLVKQNIENVYNLTVNYQMDNDCTAEKFALDLEKCMRKEKENKKDINNIDVDTINKNIIKDDDIKKQMGMFDITEPHKDIEQFLPDTFEVSKK